jgi:two-component system, NtrC family, nitrogen regulation response regulator GlnG
MSSTGDSPAKGPRILLVDDEDDVLQGVRRVLWSAEIDDIELCNDPRLALGMVDTHAPAVVLLDLIMPHLTGEQLLEQIKAKHPTISVIVVTAEYDAKIAVRCMKLGATDYLLKPVEAENLVAAVQRALDQRELVTENAELRDHFFAEQPKASGAFEGILTQDDEMLRMFSFLEAVAKGSHPVLIWGETGTGKEKIAESVHKASGRGGEFVAVNVAGLDDTMFSDTLFGHEKGAFTGANAARRGMVDRAAGGTLFLDEIGDLSEQSQVKLLRLLQEREYYPLGSDRPRRMSARVVAATHKDPSKLRQDLYFRLKAYMVKVPPLRNRRGDLALLTDHFLVLAATDLGKPTPTAPPELMTYLSNHGFPGNVRELQAMCFSAVAAHTNGVMSMKPFVDQMGDAGDIAAVARASAIVFPDPMPTMEMVERAAIDEALARTSGNRTAAAKVLGVSRNRLRRGLDGEE